MISHNHKAIFVHIPKCGGQSIESAFLRDLGLTMANRAPLLLRPNDNPNVGPPRLAHLMAADYLKYCYASAEMFERYYTFSVVRDPISRVVSMFNYLKIKDISGRRIEFSRFLNEWLPKQLTGLEQRDVGNFQRAGWFVRPQYDYLVDEDGKVLLDEIFRLEELNKKFGTIQEKTNLASPLTHINKSDQAFSTKMLSDSERKFIQELYSKDVAFLTDYFDNQGKT